MQRARIMLVDDHALFRSTLASFLDRQADLEVVGEADGGFKAVEMAQQLQPDLVLMDINMPQGDGLLATEQLKKRLPGMRICMLTATDDDDLLFDAIRAGADGYLVKHLDPDSFVQEVRRQLMGDASIPEDLAAKIIKAAHDRSHGEVARPLSEFTTREMDVLKWVGRGMTNREIAAELHIAENTVKNHLRNILQKLHYDNRVQVAAYAIRHGLVDD